MAAELIISPRARADLDEAYDWYETRRVGLGEEFLSSVDECTDDIRMNPHAFEVVRKSYRRALVKRFPYAVFYVFDGAHVTVYAVLHTARNPSKWRRRLP